MDSTLTIFSFYNFEPMSMWCSSMCTYHTMSYEYIFILYCFPELRSICILATKARTNNNNDDFVAREFWNSTFYYNEFLWYILGIWDMVSHVYVCFGCGCGVWSAHALGWPFLCLLIYHWNAIQFIFLILPFTILHSSHILRISLFHYVYLVSIVYCIYST